MIGTQDIETMTMVGEPEDIVALDLRAVAVELTAEGKRWECWQAGAYNQQSISVLWVPDLCRAGVCDGGDSQWTDAYSVDDALQRYFGEAGKEMTE